MVQEHWQHRTVAALAWAGVHHQRPAAAVDEAVQQLAGHDLGRATAATLRRSVFTVPGRLVHSGRQRRLRLSERWPWADRITRALTSIHAIPLRC